MCIALLYTYYNSTSTFNRSQSDNLPRKRKSLFLRYSPIMILKKGRWTQREGIGEVLTQGRNK